MSPDPPAEDPSIDDHPTLDPRDLHTRDTDTAASAPLAVDAPIRPPGSQLGRYRLIRELGRGGFGEVWEAESEDGRRVALKILTAARAASSDVRERFRREGRLAASVHHPRCVAILGAEELEGLPVIVMELMPGGTLQDRLDAGGAMPYREAVEAALQMIDGLEAAHELGILHRDVKPSNTFVDTDGSVKVGDFGLSKTLDADVSLTATGSFLGTPHFASPEQVRGRDVDHRSDMYSVGATLYALLTKRPPHAGASAGETLARILSEPPAPIGAAVPGGLERVVMRVLAKEPERRFATYDELRRALRPFSSQGLGRAELGRRTLAILADEVPFFLIGTSIGMYTVMGSRTHLLLALSSAVVALRFAYFFLFEWRLGRTPGKALLGLRVATEGGDVAAAGPIFLRTLVFEACRNLPGLLVTFVVVSVDPALIYDDAVSKVSSTLALLGIAALTFRMRRRNGYAGLHELASGTRVQAMSGAETSATPAATSTAELTTSDRAAGREYGPYRAVGELWRRGDEAVLVGRDDALERDVWIHEAPGPRLTSSSATRPSELRWLQGRRAPDDGWDVYALAPGAPLTRWVERAGTLGWGEARSILLDVTRQLQAWSSLEDGADLRLDLDRIWVDTRGHATLLDFPLSAGDEEAGRPLDEWRHFLHEVLVFCLDGRRPDDLTPGRLPVAGFPEHARETIAMIAARSATDHDALEERLRGLTGRVARLSRRRRAAPLLVMATLTLLVPVLVSLFFWSFFRLLDARGLELISALRAHAQTRVEGQLVSAEQRTAVEVLIAARYEVCLGLDDPLTSSILESLTPADREELEGYRRAHIPLSAERLAEAERVAGPLLAEREDKLLEFRTVEGFYRMVQAGIPIFVVVACFLGVPAVILGFLIRGSLLLRICGMEPQRRDGQRVARLRALGRAVTVWALPLCVAGGSIGSTLNVDGALPLLALVVVVAVVGSLVAIFLPRWSIPDIVAGTRIVPR